MLMPSRHALLACALLAATAGCATHAAAQIAVPGTIDIATLERADRRPISGNELVNSGGWVLELATTADGQRLDALFPEGEPYTLKFDEQGISARGSCNTLRGQYSAGAQRLDVDLAISTRMACTDDRNRADAALAEALKGRMKADLRETMPLRLRVIAQDGSVLVFRGLPLGL
jgi:hypothetical protein